VFECVACPDNALSDASSTSVGNCTCGSGFSFVATGSPCEACATGRFKRESANTHCSLCEIGAYAFGAASACTPCPANTTTAHAGAENSSAYVCRPGYVFASDVPVDRGGSCALCAPGSFSEGLGAAACDDCGSHAFLSLLEASGVRACEECPARSRAGSSALGVSGCIPFAGLLRASTNRTTRVELEMTVARSPETIASQQGPLQSAIAAFASAGCSCAVACSDVIVTRVSAAGPARRLLNDGMLVDVAILVPRGFGPSFDEWKPEEDVSEHLIREYDELCRLAGAQEPVTETAPAPTSSRRPACAPKRPDRSRSTQAQNRDRDERAARRRG
jgi:hypothetical protein